MKNPLSTTTGKVLLIVGLIVIGVALILWLLLGQPWLAFYTLLIACILVGLWFAINWGVAAWIRRKERTFDAKVAAKEGIADRRREWAGWIEELKKQGIDRYKLPMYLLVGEPQSGKSILLHNSDLHFPFGQNRLSGIGGTRGCDWWFTEEAVVLDLAGRLFTHEGGKSDEAEWEAFLGMLAAYRPQSPANGILLVLPCDGLLQDTPENVMAKSGRMQNALLALANKLEARLPVYVVLTKADKIFGFAETFHRLSVDRRQEMLGWSRALERVDHPYDANEAEEAFDAFVARMRTIRAETLSTEVLPEGQAAADRLFAFPEELSAVRPNLLQYLQRVFSQTELVDRLFFRGFYLTSGLQTGAPIAKVCSEMLGAKGQSDQRSLESIFTKQRAFFIKDLVRKRVFAESGLVRPTKRRLMRSRRNLVLGYGIGGLIVLGSLYLAIDYVREDYANSNARDYDSAQSQARTAAESGQSPEFILAALDGVASAAARPIATQESIYSRLPARFDALYVQLFDHRLYPAIRSAAERVLARRSKGAPNSHRQFAEWQADIELLFAKEVDPTDEAQVNRLKRLLGESDAPWALGDNANPLWEALEGRKKRAPGKGLPAPSAVSSNLQKAGDQFASWWDDTLEPGGTWQTTEPNLSFVLASVGLREAHAKLAGDMEAMVRDGSVFDWCEKYRVGYEILSAASVFDGKKGLKEVAREDAQGELRELEKRRARFLEVLGRPDSSWERATAIHTRIDEMIDPAKGIAGAVTKDKLRFPTDADVKVLDEDLAKACGRGLSKAVEPVRDLPRLLRELPNLNGFKDGRRHFRVAIEGRTLGMNTAFAERFPDAHEFTRALGEPEPFKLDSRKQAMNALAEVRVAVGALSWQAQLVGWKRHLETLYLEAASEFVREDAAIEDRPIDVDVLRSMQAMAMRKDAAAEEFTGGARQLLEAYLDRHETRLFEDWSRRISGNSSFAKVFEEVQAHLSSLATASSTGELGRLGGLHDDWIRKVNELLQGAVDQALGTLNKRWTVEVADGKSFAARIEDLLNDISGVQSRYGQSLEQELANSSAIDPEGALAKSIPSLNKGLERLRDYANPSGADFIQNDKLNQAVVRLLRSHKTDADRIGNTEQVVKDLGEVTNLQRKSVESPTLRGGAQVFSLNTAHAFLTILREEALIALERDFAKLPGTCKKVFDELLSKSPAELAASQARYGSAVTVSDVQEAFGKDKDLDRLLSRYRVKDASQSLLVVEQDKTRPTTREFEQQIRFLDGLQKFLLKNGELTQVADISLDIEIQPSWTGGGPLWDKARNSRLTYYHPKDSTGGTKEADPEVDRTIKLSWSFFRDGGMLRMFWAPRTDIESWDPDQSWAKDKDTALLEVRSVFAPLLLVWWWGKPDKDGGWLVEAEPVGQSKSRAPFRVTFKDREKLSFPEPPREP